MEEPHREPGMPPAWMPFLVRSLTEDARHHPQLIETRQSWLILGQQAVLKIKKPLRTAWADWSSVAARERNAMQEWRINRRLAPDVYLDVLALVQISPQASPVYQAEAGLHAQGGLDENRLRLLPHQHVRAFLADHPGVVLDWVVHMRRLPQARMLDHLIRNRSLTPSELNTLIDVLARFYQSQPRASLTPVAYVARFATELAYSRNLFALPRFARLQALPLLDAMDQALAGQTPALQLRASQHHLVDGHGDLRPEHVCMLATPVVIDALEFSHALRQVDPFDELVYLGLECAQLGAPWVCALLVARCTQVLQDWPSATLLGFYGAARAVLRARMCASHVLDVPPRCPDKWLPMAERYLALAWQALETRPSQQARQAP